MAFLVNSMISDWAEKSHTVPDLNIVIEELLETKQLHFKRPVPFFSFVSKKVLFYNNSGFYNLTLLVFDL